MILTADTQTWFWIDRLDTHQTHQTLDSLAVNPVAFSIQDYSHVSRAVERVSHIQLINPFHKPEILFCLKNRQEPVLECSGPEPGPIVIAGPRKTKQFALTANTDPAMPRIDLSTSLSCRQGLHSFFFNQSSSTLRRPIS